jgi:2-keto-4-pentenoate hydratase
VVRIEQKLTLALRTQLEERRAVLLAGNAHVGWKLGVGERERIGPGPVVGHLTSATQHQPGSQYGLRELRAPHADVEVALELGADVRSEVDPDEALSAISGYGAALEIVDLDPDLEDPQRIVASNVFHRAFVLGPTDRPLPDQLTGSLRVDGEVRASTTVAATGYGKLLAYVGGLLGQIGMSLRSGDKLIMGSIVQAPIGSGTHVVADLGELGHVGLHLR